jgi:hypothetical protein
MQKPFQEKATASRFTLAVASYGRNWVKVERDYVRLFLLLNYSSSIDICGMSRAFLGIKEDSSFIDPALVPGKWE